MKPELLSEQDIEDIEGIIPLIEDSFGVKFGKNELENTKTLGELCDIVNSKLSGFDSHDCTTQQAFYKLRRAMEEELGFPENTISPNSKLLDYLPRRLRRVRLIRIERNLGFKLNVLRVHQVVVFSWLFLFILSFVILYFQWKLGVVCLLFVYILFRAIVHFKNEIDLKTVGELADKMSRENYIKSRRNPESINRLEIESKIRDLFSDKLFMSKDSLTRDATFT